MLKALSCANRVDNEYRNGLQPGVLEPNWLVHSSHKLELDGSFSNGSGH